MESNSVPNTYNEYLECAICYDPLFIQVDDDEGESTSTIPDDVLLHCCRSVNMSGHHYHWACLQELDESGQWNRSTCPFPNCGGNPLDEQGKLLVTIRNEGGVTENFDLGAAFDEDREEPLTRKQEMAMLEAAHAGDWEAVESLLSEGVNPNAVEDTQTGITALHIAAYLGDTGLKTAEVCLRHGANTSAQTVEGYTPEQVARLRDSKSLLTLFGGASSSS